MGVVFPTGFVTCPECKGRRTMNYHVEETTRGVVTAADALTPVEVRYNQPCRTCKTVGRVKSTKPLPVMQRGRQVGTVPPSFNPNRIMSTSFLYSPRPGDFTWIDDSWVASPSLGPGDLESVPGFVRYYGDRREGT